MRPGRVVVLAALPVLAGLGALREVPPLPVSTAAFVPPPVAVVVVTDGRPAPISLPVRRATAVTERAVVSRSTRRPVRAQHRPIAARVAVPVALPAGDGYPWAADTTGGSDPWGFTKRQCVSYVAWRLAEAGKPLSTREGWGSAFTWDEVASRLGRRVSSTPTVGDVAQWEAGERGAWWSGNGVGTYTAGPYGHVALVTHVLADGWVQVAQYNGSGDRTWSTMRVKAPRYLSL